MRAHLTNSRRVAGGQVCSGTLQEGEAEFLFSGVHRSDQLCGFPQTLDQEVLGLSLTNTQEQGEISFSNQ